MVRRAGTRDFHHSGILASPLELFRVHPRPEKARWPGRSTAGPSRPSAFIQQCINNFTPYYTLEDGIYGPDTIAKFKYLLQYLRMGCLSPWSNIAHWKTFLTYMTMHGLANKPAGHFTYNGCSYPS